MRIVTPDEKNGIYLGRQGENLATQVQFDVNVAGWVETYGVGTWQLLNRRPSDPAGYPVEISVEDNIIKWDLTATDLKYAGCGTCELVYYVDEVIAKSIIYGTQILPAIDGTGEIPEPWESWIDEVKEARDEAVEAAGEAAQSERDAADSAGAASDSAEAASGSAASAEADALKAEGFAVGEQNGQPVESGSPYHENNAKYYKEQAAALAEEIEHSIDDIEALIPPQASPENQLADKSFVNSSISTNTANYISNNGQPFTSVEQLEAYSGPVSNNDYAFVTGTDSAGNTFYDRYKATVSEGVVSWAFEYRLNNSSFTAAQWAAIESGITASQVADYNAHLANESNPHNVTKDQIGLGNVDNTPDAQKPVSQAQAAALALKADKVVDAVAGNFAALDANGNLTDSGISKEISEQLEGELVNFKAAYAVPLKALSVALSPIQDLHGYDSPWPAGGGKNKLEVTATTAVDHDVTFTVNTDGTITANGTAGGTAIFEVNHSFTSDAEYILSGCPSGGGSSTYELQQNTSPILRDYGSGVTIPSGKTGSINIVIRSGVQVNNLVFKPMIRLSSVADATYAPYSNICPITGRTEINVTRCGDNLYNPSKSTANVKLNTSGATQAQSGYYTSEYIRVNPSTTYERSSQFTSNRLCCIYDEFKNFVRYVDSGYTVTIAATGEAYVRIAANNNNQKFAISGKATSDFIGNSYMISLGGTVYGGTVDVMGGNGEIAKPAVDMGDLTWTKYTSGSAWCFWAEITGMKLYPANVTPDLYCESYRRRPATSLASATSSTNAYAIMPRTNYAVLMVNDPRYSDADSFKAAVTGQKIVYELATPSALSTTPTEIDTLVGVNNVWSDAGPVTLERWKGLGEIIAAVHEALSA